MISNRTRLGRLTKLKYMMENHKKIFPNAKLRMKDWVAADPTARCGTAACAFGSACFYPPFKRAGLTYRSCRKIEEAKRNLGGTPNYKDYWGWVAAETFFGLPELEALFLFHEDSYGEPIAKDSYLYHLRREMKMLKESLKVKPVKKITAAVVARRIGKMIEKYQNLQAK